MKKAVHRLGVFIYYILLILFFSRAALAAHNPHAFDAGNQTDACGSCHNTHAAEGRNLLGVLAAGNENDIYRNCIYCHKAGGQSKLDVYNGAINGDDGTFATSGGGFLQMVTTEGMAPGYSNVTSKHNTDMDNDQELWAPGADTGAEGMMSLTCSSCHTPHGGSNGCSDCHVNATKQRRLLKREINGISIEPPLISIKYYGEDENTKYEGNVNAFCGTCHMDFVAEGENVADQTNGTYTQHTRHRVGMDPQSYPGINSGAYSSGFISQPSSILPLQNFNGGTQVNCLTCHFAHGTIKTNSTIFNRTNGQTSTSSTLLRINNRGVCQACHGK